MKKLLFALALTAFVGGTAVAHDGDKDAKKGSKKECSNAEKAACSKTGSTASAGGHSCCAKGNKTASLVSPKVSESKEEAKAEPKKATL